MASADVSISPPVDGEGAMSAGEFVLKKLFAEFVALSEKKLQDISSQPADFPLAKMLQKGEDAHFDQLLNSLNEVASFCLRSILASIFKWRDMQIQQCRSHTSWSTTPSGDATDSSFSKREKDYMTERQELAIDFIFCLVLIEVLTKLSVHPVPESFVHTIEDYAFKHFKQQEALKDRTSTNPNIQSMKKIADLYAEVIGVLSQSRFHSVRRRFFHEIRDIQNNSSTIISIIEGMSFIRVKMFPVEELEQWFTFLQECAAFFLESSREKIKHAISALLVEILLPMAAVVKFETSLPVVRKFVQMLYNHCFETAKRGKHSNSTAYIPLVTVLLAISEQSFFLDHWHIFLIQVIMPNIRRGDSKVQRTALESLNRLVWVYMVRIKGESNTVTVNRIKMVLEVLFPRGQRGVQPKDMPLNIFVKLIHFISRERLEYGMYEILELLNHGRTKTTLNPERMNIALRAFLVITDSLEKKEGDPPMPLNVGPLPSGGPQRVKTKYLSTTLTEETAKKIGFKDYYPKIRNALDGMLRALDITVGKTFLSTNTTIMSRPVEEVLGSVKPKMDLLKTCVAAIPRIMPADMTRDDLIDLLSRLTIHIDKELVRTTFTSLQNIITNFPSWRHHVIKIFALYILREIPDNCPLVLEAVLRMLINMVTHWKSLIGMEQPSAQQETSATNTSKKEAKSSSSKAASGGGGGGGSGGGGGGPSSPGGNQDGDEGGEMYYFVPWVEACGLVTMCSYRPVTRRLSLVLLKEIRSLHTALQIKSEVATCTVMDVIDQAMPIIIKRYLATLTLKERSELRTGHHALNINWMADRTSCFLEQGGSRDSLRDAWAQCVAGLLEPHLLPESCPTSIHIAWPYAYHRMCKAYAVLDPGFVAHEKGDRPPSLKGRRPIMSNVEMFLWRNYLIFLSCTAPPSTSLQASLMSSGDSTVLEGSGRNQLELNARHLFHKVVPFIRIDGEIREVAITALGMVHPNAFGDLVEELYTVIRDAIDQRKGDNPRKRRKRETLRVQITRVFALTAEHGCFQQSPMTRTEKGDVTTVFLEFIEGIKNLLEAESDRVMPYMQDLRLFFATFISNIINSLPQGKDRHRLFSEDMRYSLFHVFANWCGLMLSDSGGDQDVRPSSRHNMLSFNALQAMSALLCCGPVFHPKCLDKDESSIYCIYRWLENMLRSDEPKTTQQALLQEVELCRPANDA